MKSWMIGALALAAPVSAQEVDPSRTTHEQIPTCVHTIQDQATGNCVGVSSEPTDGMLMPLGLPNLQVDSNGSLRTLRRIVSENTIHAFGALLTNNTLLAQEGIQTFGNLRVGGGLSMADVVVSQDGPATVLIEADTDNSNEFDHPVLTFSQDGGAVQSFVGLQDGENDFAVRNVYAAGGLRFDLHTSSTRDWEFRRRTSTPAVFDVEARLTQSGNLQLDGSVSTPAADLAEYYPAIGAVEPGDVVAFHDESLALERAVAGPRVRLAGIVSSDPGLVLGLTYTDEELAGEDPDDLCDGDQLAAIRHEIQVNRRAPLALTGRVPCKVTAANGPIRAGDMLTISGVPGHAMKATNSGAVIGAALESWRAGEGTILVLANLGWFSPTQDLEGRVAELEAQVARLLAR